MPYSTDTAMMAIAAYGVLVIASDRINISMRTSEQRRKDRTVFSRLLHWMLWDFLAVWIMCWGITILGAICCNVIIRSSLVIGVGSMPFGGVVTWGIILALCVILTREAMLTVHGLDQHESHIGLLLFISALPMFFDTTPYNVGVQILGCMAVSVGVGVKMSRNTNDIYSVCAILTFLVLPFVPLLVRTVRVILQ